MASPSFKIDSAIEKIIQVPREVIARHFCDSIKFAPCPLSTALFHEDSVPFCPNNQDWSEYRDKFAEAYLAWEICVQLPCDHPLKQYQSSAFGTWNEILDSTVPSFGLDVFVSYFRTVGVWEPLLQRKESILADLSSAMTNYVDFFSEVKRINSFGPASLPIFINLIRFLDDDEGSILSDLIGIIGKVFLSTGMKRKTWSVSFFSSVDNFWCGPEGFGIHSDAISSALESGLSDFSDVFSDGPNFKFERGHHCRVEDLSTLLAETPLPTLGCVTGETIVYVYDADTGYRKVPIRSVKPGDIVYGLKGSKAAVRRVYTHKADDSPILVYGINGEDCFFTDDHIIYTANGWKAINPKKARKVHPTLKINLLRPGDIVFNVITSDLLALDGTKEVNYSPIRVKSIPKKRLAMEDTVYNLEVVVSQGTFHANNLLVGSHSAESIIPAIAKNIRESMAAKTAAKFYKRIEEDNATYNQAFGNNFISNIKSEVEAQDEEKENRIQRIATGQAKEDDLPRPYSPNHLHATYKERIMLSAMPGTETEYELPDLSLVYGELLVNNERVPTSDIVENVAYWSRVLSDGTVENGYITFDAAALNGSGAVKYLKVGGEEKSVKVQVYNTTMVFRMEEPSDFEYFLAFRTTVDELTGTLFTRGHMMETALNHCAPVGDDDQVCSAAMWGVEYNKFETFIDESFKVGFIFEVRDSWGDGNEKFEGTMSYDGSTIEGISTIVGEEGETPFNGSIQCMVYDFTPLSAMGENIAMPSRRNHSITAEIRERHIAIMNEQLSSAKPTNSIADDATGRGAGSKSKLAKVRDTMNTLSIMDLLSQAIQPDTENVNNIAQEKMQNYMNYCLTAEQRRVLAIDVQPPPLDGSEREFLARPEILKFFQEKYINSYTVEALYPNDNLRETWGEEHYNVARSRSGYWWKGDGVDCVGTDTNFFKVQDKASEEATNAFIKMEEYLKDMDNNPQVDWAKDYYDAVSTDPTNAGIIMRFSNSLDTSEINNIAMQLESLDRGRGNEYSTKFLNTIPSGRLTRMIQQIAAAPIEEQEKVVEEWFKTVIEEILGRTGGIFDELNEDIRDTFLEQGIDMNQTKAEIARDGAVLLSSSTSFFANVISEMNGQWDIHGAMIRASMEIPKEVPTWKNRSQKTLAVICNVSTIGSSIHALFTLGRDWDGLTSFEQAQTVIEGMCAGVDLIAACTTLADVATRDSTREEKQRAEVELIAYTTDISTAQGTQVTARRASEMELGGTPTPEQLELQDSRRRASRIDINSSTGNSKAKRFLNGTAAGTAKLGELLDLAGGVMSMVTLANRWGKDYYDYQGVAVQIVDSLLMVTQTVNVLSGIVNVVPGKVPGKYELKRTTQRVATGFAIIGFVLSVISFFITKDPPPRETPQQSWINNFGKQYVDALPVPNAAYALTSVEAKIKPTVVKDREEEKWLLSLLKVDDKVATGDLQTGSFNAGNIEELESAFVESSGNKVKIVVSSNITGDDEDKYEQYVTIFFASDKKLTAGQISANENVTINGYKHIISAPDDDGRYDPENDTETWESFSDATNSRGWYLYRAEKVDNYKPVTIELSCGENFKLYAARQTFNPED